MRLLIGLSVAFAVGCSMIPFGPKGVKLEAVSGAVSEIRSIVASVLPEGAQSVSSNGREVTSKPFVFMGDGSLKPYTQGPDRFIALVTVLGDRRPYDVEVYVRQERRVVRGSEANFEAVTTDIRWSQMLAKRIQAELAKRRDDRNLIDDFRVY